MRILLLTILTISFLAAKANNVRISPVEADADGLITQSGNILKLSFTVSWDNSWRDAYNHDAVYIFLKYRLRSDGKDWYHIPLQDVMTCSAGMECVPAPGNAANRNRGVFIRRKVPGNGRTTATVTVSWDIKDCNDPVTKLNVMNGEVFFSASATEMVYVPRGAFYAGDSYSKNSFWHNNVAVPETDDLIHDRITLFSYPSEGGKAAADHKSLGVNDTTSSWCPQPNTEDFATWRVDFGASTPKKVVRFGVCAAQGTSKPGYWHLDASNDLRNWDTLYIGKSADWYYAQNTAYPVEHTIRLDSKKTKNYRYYRLWLQKITGLVAVKSISMTDQERADENQHSYLVDGTMSPLDYDNAMGAQDGETWSGGTLPANYPNGYREFYAMKYELTQEQYVDFLNKLNYTQQTGLLGKSLVDGLRDSVYLFGGKKTPRNRNGIMVERKTKGSPLVFSNNLNTDDPAGRDGDGQSLACNYLTVNDMLAYADWSGLRPLSEMEYEKMGRPLYDPGKLPVAQEYAWNSPQIFKAAGLVNAGKHTETLSSGNANYGSDLGGPVRAGAFAASARNRIDAGTSFWGLMELSGNLAEIYYNANTAGRALQAYDFGVAHGDGALAANGLCNVAVAQWPVGMSAFAVRGGSFASVSPEELAVSDRRYYKDYFTSAAVRDSSVTFRLGRSCKPSAEVVKNILVMANGQTTDGQSVVADTVRDGKPYKISSPEILPEGNVYSVLWYVSETGGTSWKLMDGQNSKDLNTESFTGRAGLSIPIREYRFKRKVILPDNDAEAVAILRVVNPEYTISKTQETMAYGDQTRGITVKTANPAEFTWKDVKTGDVLTPTSETVTMSYYRARCDDFSDLKFGETRKITVETDIYGFYRNVDTIDYIIPVPTYALDKDTAKVVYTGGGGIKATMNYPVNINWVDVKSGETLLSQTNVTTSLCNPKWLDFTAPVMEEVRKVKVEIQSIDGCYSFNDEVFFILPRCMETTPFANSTQTFANVSGSVATLQVTSENWDVSVPRAWEITGVRGGITINATTGVLSGLQSTLCNITVTVADSRCPDLKYSKKVKETYRSLTSVTSYTLNVPPGSYKLYCWGAGGYSQGGYSGGAGGYAYGTHVVGASGGIYYVYVGGTGTGSGGGWNGGGAPSGYGGGGGATDIRFNGTAYSNRVIVGAGGGGSSHTGNGGAGGGLTGYNGSNATGSYGIGGTQSSAGYNAGFGYGGSGTGHGGGGGSGYYGGGGGHSCAYGGGGGSSYYGSLSSPGTTAGSGASANNNGSARIDVL